MFQLTRLSDFWGWPHRPDQERLWLNWAMHWGQGIILGPVRALMAEHGLRGPVGSFIVLKPTLFKRSDLGERYWFRRTSLDLVERRTDD